MYKRESSLDRCLIFAKEAQNMSISGGGGINGNVENVTVSNCVFEEIGHVGIQFELCEGGDMGNMIFSNLAMHNVRVPVYMAFFQQHA